MIRLVKRLDPGEHFIEGAQFVSVDLLQIADHARHGAKAAGDPHGARVGKAWQARLEHARVELIGLAIEIEVGPREARADQRGGEAERTPPIKARRHKASSERRSVAADRAGNWRNRNCAG